MSGHVEKRAKSMTYIPNSIRWSYVMKLELMVINHLKKTSNYNAASKFIVAEANEQRWEEQNRSC
jgi:hypothetical protein